MTRNEISTDIAKLLLDENISPFMSYVDCYNYWTQKRKIRVEDPDVAMWTLGLVKKLLMTDRKLLTSLLNDEQEVS